MNRNVTEFSWIDFAYLWEHRYPGWMKAWTLKLHLPTCLCLIHSKIGAAAQQPCPSMWKCGRQKATGTCTRMGAQTSKTVETVLELVLSRDWVKTKWDTLLRDWPTWATKIPFSWYALSISVLLVIILKQKEYNISDQDSVYGSLESKCFIHEWCLF